MVTSAQSVVVKACHTLGRPRSISLPVAASPANVASVLLPVKVKVAPTSKDPGITVVHRSLTGALPTAARDTIVGVVACGYADGYPRAASNLAPAAVDGVMTKLIGRVSMDMLFVDLTDICDVNGFPSVRVGSSVELWGDQVSANDVAKAAGTIAYELFCNIKRVQFKYSDK